jgi:type 1 fimbria pilin
VIKKLLLAAVTVFMALSASANNRNQCYWFKWTGGPTDDTASRTTNFEFLSMQELKLAPIGQSMGSFPLNYAFQGLPYIKCSNVTVPTVKVSYWLEGAALAPGYTDVYSTNVPGVGFRLTERGYFTDTVPFSRSIQNAVALAFGLSDLYVEFIRTAFAIKKGTVNLNFRVFARYDDWTAVTFYANSSVVLTTKEYFTGCAGAKTINFPLGKVNAADLPLRKTRRLNLEVVCTGLPAGSKLPVMVYFEGSFNGPGRLSLTPGGATGVEIALSRDGAKLPGSAVDMDWMRSESGGERYRLPMDVGYERIGNSTVKAGQANGTMNYVIDYN